MYPDRIPYDSRINSHLSVAKHYGGIKINGSEYVLDYASCTPEIINGEERVFPDLVKVQTKKKSKIKQVSMFDK